MNSKWLNYLFKGDEEPNDSIKLTKEMEDFISSAAFLLGTHLPKEPLSKNERYNPTIKQYYHALKRGIRLKEIFSNLYRLSGNEMDPYYFKNAREDLWKALNKDTRFPGWSFYDLINIFRIMTNVMIHGDESEYLAGYFEYDDNGNIIRMKDSTLDIFDQKFSDEFEKLESFLNKYDRLDDEYKKAVADLVLEPDGAGMDQAISAIDSLSSGEEELDETNLRDLDAAVEKRFRKDKEEYASHLQKRMEKERERHKIHGRRGSEPDLPSYHVGGERKKPKMWDEKELSALSALLGRGREYEE